MVGEVSFFFICSTLMSAKLDMRDDMEVDIDMVVVMEEEAASVVVQAVEDTVEVGTIMDMVGGVGVEVVVKTDGK